MATPPQLLQLAFAAGIDQSSEDEVLDPMAGFRYLQNARQERRGGIRRRLGFTALGEERFSGQPRFAGARLHAHRGVPVVIDGEVLDAYSESKDRSGYGGRVPNVSVERTTVAGLANMFFDAVACNSYVATAYFGAYGNIYVSIETLDGAPARSTEFVVNPGAYTTGQPYAALGAIGNSIFLLAHKPSTNSLEAYYLDTTSVVTLNNGWQSVGTLVTDVWAKTGGLVPEFPRMSVVSISDRILVAYVTTILNAAIIAIDDTGVLDSETFVSGTVEGVGVDADENVALLVYADGTDLIVSASDPKNFMTSYGGPSTVIAGFGTLSSHLINVVVDPSYVTPAHGKGRVVASSGGYLKEAEFTVSGGTISVTNTATLAGVRMCARPFVQDGRFYGLFSPGAALGGPPTTVVLCDWTEVEGGTGVLTDRVPRPVAVANADLAAASVYLDTVVGGLLGYSSVAATSDLHPLRISATKVAYATGAKANASAVRIDLLTYDFADQKRWNGAEHNGGLSLSGGILSYYDGRRVAEVGFLHTPAAPELSSSGTGITGTFSYVVTYEEVDGAGNWCISGVSAPVSITVANKQVDVSVAPLVLTSRMFVPEHGVSDFPVRVCLYRTQDGGEAPYHLLASAPNTPSSPITFADQVADATLAERPLLYGTGNLPGTNGSAQDRRAPPYCQDVCSYNGMLVVASGSDLWWSGQQVAGEGTWFSPAFQVPIGEEATITALAAQDGTLYAFTEHGIYAVAGEAPSDNGAQGGLGTPRRLAADVGCIDPRSVVVTSLGIFFRSRNTIELLSRSQSVEPIGEQIRETLAQFPVVTSAVLDERNRLVRISLAQAEEDGFATGEGATVVYDLSTKAWQSVDVYPGQPGVDHEPAQSACVVEYRGERRYAWLSAGGFVWVENDENDAQAYTDNSGGWITMAAETAHFKASGIQGRQQLNRVLLLARTHSDVDLSVSLGYNYEQTLRAARTWTSAELDALLTAGWPITQLKHDPHDDAECQAVRARIEDAEPSDGPIGNGRGATWLALTLDVTPQTGAFDVPEEAA